ncbi:MAG TPA: ABC transporter permease [Acidimicrobiales bacterium]|jgi:osmoprotectant transport system permease protein|nr:ABC transporter permease [Acidimicrobiales bacterium]
MTAAANGTSFDHFYSYLTGHLGGGSGVIDRLLQHIGYSIEALAIGALIAVPLGLWSGHTGRGATVLSLLSNASRALPTLGLLTIFAILIGVGLNAAIIPLVFIAIPSILVNSYVAIAGVDRSLVDAAKGMGLTPWQVVRSVELPVGLPIIVLGFRTAAIQVVSTATIAAYVGLGGLGRFIIDGYASRNYAEIGAGAVTVALFAIAVEALFLLGQRLLVSPGVRRAGI